MDIYIARGKSELMAIFSCELADIEMECLATWKEGSTQYLVARLSGTGLVNDESRYRCFAYAKSSNSTWNLAQSGDASCNGLTSAIEGAKTLKMMQSEFLLSNTHSFFGISSTARIKIDQSI